MTTTDELRAALAGSDPQILLDAATFDLAGTQLTIDRPVTLVGAGAPPGPDASTIDAGGLSRAVRVTAQGVEIRGVVITGGDVSDKNKDNTGGGILIDAGKGKNGTPGALTLVDSTVSGNLAVDGAGIENNGVLDLITSTVDSNNATGKGGGLRDNGTSTVENVTFEGNTATQGGGISATGTTDITHATIVRNRAGNSSTGGVDVNGGAISLAYSIISNNVRLNDNAASDCSGSPTFTGVNIVSDTSGCNPDGDVLEGDAGVGPVLGAFGGPTETVPLLSGSQAIDAYPADAAGDCVVTADQRGAARPGFDGCDLGAYEVAELSAEYSLDVDTSNYEAVPPAGSGLPAGTVEVGAVTIPTDRILDELVSRGDDPSTSTISDLGLRSIGLRSITLQDIGLRSIGLRSIGLRSIVIDNTGLRSIGLRSIDLAALGLRSIGLRSILLSDIPLEDEGGWSEYLIGTQFEDVPHQSVTLEDLVSAGLTLDGLSLADVSIDATGLRSIGLRSILLADAGLRSIPLTDDLIDGTDLERATAWCEVLDGLCGTGDGQITVEELATSDLDLLSAQLAGYGVDDVPIFDIPLDGLASTGLRSIGLRSIGLRSIDIASTGLRSIGLRSIGLRSIEGGAEDWIDLLVDCTLVDCSTDPANETTLGDAATASPTALRDVDTATVGVLVDAVSAIVEGCADPTTREEIGEDDCTFVEGLSFGDLLLAFVGPDDPSWETLNLDSLLQNIADPLQPTFDYVATVTIEGGPADLDLGLMLPAGFAAARAPGDPAPTFDGVEVEPVDESLSDLQFLIPGVEDGTHTLVVPARAGLTTGTGEDFTAAGTASATQGGQDTGVLSDTAVVTVVEAFEDDSASATVPTLTQGELQLAHISREDDYDLYTFTVPESLDGAQARILMSNIPTDVDYDLTVYTPRKPPLRNAPTQELSSLGDIGFDLAPVDDVYSTDVVDDIQLDIPADRGLGDYSVRDTSTKRSNEDEEVGTGPLEGGETYYLAVTSFNAGLSPEPYGLRIRLDGAVPALAECAAPRFSGVALPAPESVDVPADANTLYVTNSQWLSALPGADVNAIVTAIGATTGTNGVVAGFLPVDSDPAVRDLYAAWDANRCDPLARNAVVTAIGSAIDTVMLDLSPTGLIDESPIENVVIVGGDGVVPMAAVPDLTEFSNETTFAGETVFDNGGVLTSNELTGALANGYLLSDDPYATFAGISVQNGDHELFIPTWTVGRLVETGSDILTQLQNFVAYDGRLDPSTAGALAAGVTGYDFLTDGANAVADELDAADGDLGTSRLIDDTWDRNAFLAFLDAEDYQLLSPNAHYDYESLLPAAADGTLFSDNDLVFTSDVDDPTVPARLPVEAVILTMGCHAGLPIDDVQVGMTVPDWAQTYAPDNVYAAHTTYGYGDTEIVAYSERLTEIFARNIAALANGDAGAPVSLGAALAEAKQEYLATTLVLTPYDEKILQSMTHYGLPMFTVGDGAAPAGPAAELSTLATEESATSGAVTFGAPTPSGATPVTVGPLSLGVSAPGPTTLNRNDTASGSYFDVDGNVVAAQYRPIQPLVVADIPAGDTPATGFLITELTSIEFPEADFPPLYLQPTIDLGENEGRIEPGDGSFPASLQRVVPGVGDSPDTLLVAAGQFQDRVDGDGLQRVFTDMSGVLYREPAGYSGPTDAPALGRIIGRVGDDEEVVQFEVTTDDTAFRVRVLFREVGSTEAWRGVDLFRPDAGQDLWLGGAPGIPAQAAVEFFVQAVGVNGRVAISDNKVYNYLTSVPLDADDLTIELDGPLGDNGYYTGDVTAQVVATGENPVVEPVEYSVDSGPFLPAPDGVVVSGNGGHVVVARDAAGSREFSFFVIDEDAPDVVGTASGSSEGPVAVSLAATDVGQSGVVSITYTVTKDGAAEPSVETPGAGVTFEVTEGGEYSITAVARDGAGNTGELAEPITFTIVDDVRAPNVSAVPAGTAGSNGWFTSPVTLTVTADDDVGVADITVDGSTTTFDGSSTSESVDVDIVAEGTSTIGYSATDTVGKPSAPGTIDVKIDTSDPTVSLSVAMGVATYSCADSVSGIDACDITVTLDDGTLGDDDGDGMVLLPTDRGTATVEVTARDKAGRTTTETATFLVKFDVCLDYDPDQPKNIGSNYTIRLTLCDADGTNLSDRRITLTAVSIDGVVDPGPNDSGKANDGYEFRFASGGYIYNLDTTALANNGIGPGRHDLYFTITERDGTVSWGSAPFTLSE